MLSRCSSVVTYQGNELTRNSSGNTRPQSFQLAEPLWTDPGVNSGISVREQISTLKKSACGELIVQPSPKILAARKTHTHTHTHTQPPPPPLIIS